MNIHAEMKDVAMTQQALRELVELAERIPDAPWFTVDSVWLPGPDVPTYVIAGDSDPHVGKPVVDAFLKDEFAEGESEEDAVAEADAIMAFCAAARNAIPHLKALLGEQREAQGVDY